MSTNFIETASNYFTADFVNEASARFGENNAGISKSMAAIIPAAIAGIINKATSGEEGEQGIFNMATAAALSLPAEASFDSLCAYQVEDKLGRMLPDFLSVSQTGMVTATAAFAGVKNKTVSSLLSMVLPVVMGLLGCYARQHNLSASGLTGFLAGQNVHVTNALPAGLYAIAGRMGLAAGDNSFNSPLPPKVQVERPTVGTSDSAAGNKWALPLIIAMLVIALLCFFLRKQKDGNETIQGTTAAVVTSADTMSTVLIDTATIPPELIKVILPNGKELAASKGGLEDELVRFLKANWKAMSDDALNDKWFDFDNLLFEPAKAALLPGSEKQLQHVADILKAFPDANIKIGAFSDASGDDLLNTKLTQDRAAAVRSGLETLGVGAQLLEAEGYGSKFAKFPADAGEEQRMLDRHVSLSVRK